MSSFQVPSVQYVPRSVRGIQGQLGSQGPQGVTGPQGVQGIQGVKGEQGVTGPQGIQGPTGSSSGSGMDSCIIGGFVQIGSTQNNTYFGMFKASDTDSSATDENKTLNTIPYNCTISNIRIIFSAVPGSSYSGGSTGYCIAVRKNRTTTPISNTIFNITGIVEGSADFNAGDNVSFMVQPNTSIMETFDPVVGLRTNTFYPNQVNFRWTATITRR